MHGLLIQPTVDTLDEYETFAADYDLGFELVDFAYPNVLDGDVRAIVDRYKSLPDPRRLISAHGPFLDLYLNSPDPAVRAVAVKRINQTLSLAAELELQFVVFHTNRLPMITAPAFHENWVRSNAAFWSEAVHEHDITVVLENMWDKSPELVARVLEAVDSPRLKVCLDTAHHLLFSQESLERWFAVLGKNIAYLHLCDNLGELDNELALGTGVVDFRELTRLTKRSGAQPVAVIETPTLERIEASMRFLQGEWLYPLDC